MQGDHLTYPCLADAGHTCKFIICRIGVILEILSKLESDFYRVRVFLPKKQGMFPFLLLNCSVRGKSGRFFALDKPPFFVTISEKTEDYL